MEQTLTSLSSNAEELQKSITDHFGCKLNKGCVAWSCPEPDPPCPILHWSHLGVLLAKGNSCILETQEAPDAERKRKHLTAANSRLQPRGNSHCAPPKNLLLSQVTGRNKERKKKTC
uniref:Uncharacterized protein n=1 Tax=Knipowitschia caucasica TaxID=637954 RepID=A0AAV2MAW1_KNICA